MHQILVHIKNTFKNALDLLFVVMLQKSDIFIHKPTFKKSFYKF